MIKEIVSLNLETITQNKTKNTSKGKGEDKGESHQAVSAWFRAYIQVLYWKGHIFRPRNPGFKSCLYLISVRL